MAVKNNVLIATYNWLRDQGLLLGTTTSPHLVKDYSLEIAKGNISGHRALTKFGRNPTVGTSGFNTIWNGGGSYTGFNATGAEIVSIVSSSINDVNSTGTGAWSIRLYGLDTNLEEITEDILLNGTTAVLTTLSYKRLDRIKVLDAGSIGWNVGDLTVRQSVTTANIFAVVPATYNSTMIAAYTIPSNMTGFLTSQTSSIANRNAASVIVRMKIRQPGLVFTVAGEAAMNSTGTGFVRMEFRVPHRLEGGTDLFIEAEASSTVAVTAFMDIMLVAN